MIPDLDRHRWAVVLATRHAALAHEHHRGVLSDQLTALRARGTVSGATVAHILHRLGDRDSLLAPEERAELAWLLAYCIEAGSVAIASGVAVPGEVHRWSLELWGVVRSKAPFTLDDPPDWWPWPAAGECSGITHPGSHLEPPEVCGEPTPRGALFCPAHTE